MKNFLLLFVIWLIVHSCVTYERCVDKYAFANEIVKKDTVIYIDKAKIDTFLLFREIVQKQNDTIILEKERIKLQFIKKNDTLLLYSECAPDTIRVPVQKIQYVFTPDKPQQQKSWYWYHFLIIGIIVVILIILHFILK